MSKPNEFDLDEIQRDMDAIQAILSKGRAPELDLEALEARVLPMIHLHDTTPAALELGKAQALALLKSIVVEYGPRGGQARPYSSSLAWELRKSRKITSLEMERWKKSGYLPDHVSMEDDTISPNEVHDTYVEDLAKAGAGLPPISRLAAAHNPGVAKILTALAAANLAKSQTRDAQATAHMLARRGW